MKDIERQIKDSKKWQDAQKSLEEFKEMMKLIKQYPVKSAEPLILRPEYIPNKRNTIRYPFIN